MKKINIGVIGCGYWGPNFVRNFSQIPNVKIVAICDMRPDKLEYIKGIYPSLQTYSDYRRVLDIPDLDAVVISTPASTHYSISREALLKKKHVLVEKPISIDIAEAGELINLSKKIKRTLMVGHTFLYNPAVNKIKEIIAEGELGRIYYLHSKRTNLGPLRQDVNAIWDLSPHDISIINYILDSPPQEISAYAQKFLSHNLEDVGFVICKYPKQILAHIHVSWLDPKKIRELTIIGSKKMLVYNDIDINEPIKVYDKSVMSKKYEKDYKTFREFQLIIREGEVAVPKVNMQEPLRLECQHFLDCIINKNTPRTDGKNGLEILKVLGAINKSLKRKGEVVSLR